MSKTRHIEDPTAPEAHPAPYAPGRDAPRPIRFGWAAWREVLGRVYANVGRHHLSVVAAGVAFFGVLAIFPALAALVGLYGLIADPADVIANLAEIRPLLPPDAYGLIESQLQALLDVPQQRLGVAFVVAILLALWTARAGVSTLVEGLNIVYREIDASFRFIAAAVRDAKAGEIGCIVTAPINKEALNLAGHHYDGHTGMLAHLTGSRSSWMLLAAERMSVIHVSTHVSLKRRDRSRAKPRAHPRDDPHRPPASAPHRHRQPAHRGRRHQSALRRERPVRHRGRRRSSRPPWLPPRPKASSAVGPISADTVFHRAYNGAFDLVVAQYHDQGHIPMKLVAFDTGVNVSLGLPIDRTSVDHGTAFDIAGTGKANHVNMNAAIAYARKLAGTPRVTQ